MTQLPKSKAIQFVILLGVVSLFADMTYEAARSIAGPYLSLLGASGTVVGFVAGLGELFGYSFRLVSGYLSDKTGKYWTLTFIGYAINLLAVPLLALAGNWQVAAGLMIAERFGKAIRNPARDAILSYATKETGRGWGFGLHEAMDQIGALLGPLIVAIVLYIKGSYQMSFAILLIPALLALMILALARKLYPHPENLERESPELKTKGLTVPYWLYVAGLSLVGAGYVDFSLIAYHFERNGAVSPVWTPILYSIAMGVGGLAALIFGKLFDKKGLLVIIWATIGSAFFAPLVFLNNFWLALAGMVLWGIGLGAHESIMPAFVANLVSMNKRGTAYGILNIWFGVFWFLGSAFMGVLYDISIPKLVIFSMAAQLISIPIFIKVKNATSDQR